MRFFWGSRTSIPMSATHTLWATLVTNPVACHWGVYLCGWSRCHYTWQAAQNHNSRSLTFPIITRVFWPVRETVQLKLSSGALMWVVAVHYPTSTATGHFLTGCGLNHPHTALVLSQILWMAPFPTISPDNSSSPACSVKYSFIICWIAPSTCHFCIIQDIWTMVQVWLVHRKWPFLLHVRFSCHMNSLLVGWIIGLEFKSMFECFRQACRFVLPAVPKRLSKADSRLL